MITEYLADKIQDFVFGKTAFVPANDYYVGLSKSEIDFDGTGLLEPSGNAYARVKVENNKTNWTNSNEGIISNKVQVAFPESSGDWGVCTHVFIADAASAGNILFSSELNIPRDIKADSQLFFAAGGLEFTLTSE